VGRLDGTIALVTGASRGIGRAIAVALAREGADVAFTFNASAAAADETAAAVRAEGRRALSIKCNASVISEVDATVAAAVAEFGTIDVLVNNAGVTKDGLLVRMSEADWDAVVDTNLKGAWAFTKGAARIMMSKRSGSIVNITSVVGITGNAGQTNYASSKAGLIGLTKSVARELASRNVRANAIAPGYIDTDMTAKLTDQQREAMTKSIPLGRIGTGDEVAAAVVFLASSESRYITGQVLCVDGGMAM
jgi:3-oxoacyl-[acyl-carrier protein] reductase